jgi:hypothetical protein
MIPVVRSLMRLSLALGSLALSLPQSDAQQLGHYIGGFTGLENGSTPPAGLYAAAFGLVEPINSIKGPNGNTVLRPDINLGGVIAAYQVMTPKKILGADYGLAFLVPVLNTRFNSNVFDASAEAAGVSDIAFQPIILGWEKGPRQLRCQLRLLCAHRRLQSQPAAQSRPRLLGTPDSGRRNLCLR